MSRRNEIKKDIWKIMQDVYHFSDHVDITDRQNDFLDKVIQYLEGTLSLRRKGEKGKSELEDDSAPLERPVKTPRPEWDVKAYKRMVRNNSNLPEQISTPESKPAPAPVVIVTTTESVKKTRKSKKTKDMAAISINMDAIPPHLRKYVRS